MGVVDIDPVIFEIEQKYIDLENHVWVTSEGEEIPVRCMTTTYINNCIRRLNDNSGMYPLADYLWGKRKWLRIFYRELGNRQ